MALRRFSDVSGGAGTLPGAAAGLLPEFADIFHDIEPFPPEHRTLHPDWRVSYLAGPEERFDGGTCIEVVKHLPPPIPERMRPDLAAVSEPAAQWLSLRPRRASRKSMETTLDRPRA